MPRIKRRFGNKRINHVIIRGVNKQDIFMDQQDKNKFTKELIHTKQKYHYNLYAYVIMPNHVHLLMKDKEGNLPLIMNSLQTRYVKYFNQKQERVGHLFQDRYFSKIIEEDEYFKNTIRYIHRNPEKAFLAKKEKYKWSSYHQYIEKDESIVDISEFLEMLNKDQKKALEEFKQYHKQDAEKFFSDEIEYELHSKLTDEQLAKALEEKLKIDNIQKIQQYRNETVIKLMKEIVKISYISISQLSRVTGINRKILGQIKKELE